MKVIVQTRKIKGIQAIGSKEFSSEGYTMIAEPNSNGDLIIYRDHSNMMQPQIVASFAAETWDSHELVWDDDSH